MGRQTLSADRRLRAPAPWGIGRIDCRYASDESSGPELNEQLSYLFTDSYTVFITKDLTVRLVFGFRPSSAASGSTRPGRHAAWGDAAGNEGGSGGLTHGRQFGARRAGPRVRAQFSTGNHMLRTLSLVGPGPASVPPDRASTKSGQDVVPDVAIGSVVPFDQKQRFTAFNAGRRSRQPTRPRCEAEVGLSVASLTRLAKVGRVVLPHALRTARRSWRSAADFTKASPK